LGEVKHILALIASKILDVNEEAIACIQNGDAVTIQLLSTWCSAKMKQKRCQFCRLPFFKGSASRCAIKHACSNMDFDCNYLGHSGTFYGKCDLCGKYVGCNGESEDY
jgi:hypothetical protein